MIAYTHNANTSILGESKTIPYSFYCGVHIRWLVSTIFGTEYIEIISNTKICLPHLLNVAALPWENLITTFELSDIVFSGIWVALKWASFEELRIWVEDTDLDDWGDHHLHCSHAGSQALVEVYQRLVGVFLWQLFPDGLQSDFQLISRLGFFWLSLWCFSNTAAPINFKSAEFRATDSYKWTQYSSLAASPAWCEPCELGHRFDGR